MAVGGPRLRQRPVQGVVPFLAVEPQGRGPRTWVGLHQGVPGPLARLGQFGVQMMVSPRVLVKFND